MTTTTTAQPAPARLAWAPLIWIGALHLGALLAFVPGLLFLVRAGRLPLPALADRRHRDLPDLSPPADASQLRAAAAVARICADDHREPVPRRAGAIGWVADHRRHHAHSDEEDDTHTPQRGFFWAHMCWWMTVDDDSEHTPEYYEKWAPTSAKTRSIAGSTATTSSFPIAAVRRACTRSAG